MIHFSSFCNMKKKFNWRTQESRELVDIYDVILVYWNRKCSHLKCLNKFLHTSNIHILFQIEQCEMYVTRHLSLSINNYIFNFIIIFQFMWKLCLFIRSCLIDIKGVNESSIIDHMYQSILNYFCIADRFYVLLTHKYLKKNKNKQKFE